MGLFLYFNVRKLVNFRSLVGKYFIWLCFIFNVFSDFIKRIVIGILLSLL